MTINRSLWTRVVSRHAIPSLPCPRCRHGRLKVSSRGVQQDEPRHSINAHTKNPNDWDPTWDVNRWSATLVCDEVECGEIVNLIGDTEFVETEGDDINQSYEDALRIQAAFPAPPMIQLSDNVPAKVRDELRIAFRLHWTDTSACVARLRTAVERMLDEQQVPKVRMNNAGTSSRMDLYQRIKSFADGAGSAHKGQLDALRNIGNLGTHGSGSVDDGDLFDALDVLEYVLAAVYDTKTINAMAVRLSNKGKEKQ